MKSNLAAGANPPLLYICNNDGSDPRVAKEVRTLSRAYDVHFLGTGAEGRGSFVRSHCASFSLVPGSARSVKSLLRLLGRVVMARIQRRPTSIHVVDEQMLAVLWPALLGQPVVLDVFDSLFLRINKPNNRFWLAKAFLYAFASRIIVTDEYRRDLLARFAKPKSIVIPNVPPKSVAPRVTKQWGESLTLGYFGSLAEGRGTKLVRELLSMNPDIKVLCAGWVADEPSRVLTEHPNVTFLGVVDQATANEIIARDVDYLVAVYPRGNLNNYYASPNKLYDAIHTGTPLIIGDNVKVSEFVETNGLGLVLDHELSSDPLRLGELLKKRRRDFTIGTELIEIHCWERYEDELIALHR